MKVCEIVMQLDPPGSLCLQSALPPPSLRNATAEPLTLAGPDGPPALCPPGQMEGRDWIPLPTPTHPGAKRLSCREVEVSGTRLSRLQTRGSDLSPRGRVGLDRAEKARAWEPPPAPPAYSYPVPDRVLNYAATLARKESGVALGESQGGDSAQVTTAQALSSWSGNRVSWTHEARPSEAGVPEGCGAWWWASPARGWILQKPGAPETRPHNGSKPELRGIRAGLGEAEMGVQGTRDGRTSWPRAKGLGAGRGAGRTVTGPRFKPDPPSLPTPGAGGAAGGRVALALRKRPPLGAHRGAGAGRAAAALGRLGRGTRAVIGSGEGAGRAGPGGPGVGGRGPGSGPAQAPRLSSPHCSQLMSLAVVSGRLPGTMWD